MEQPTQAVNVTSSSRRSAMSFVSQSAVHFNGFQLAFVAAGVYREYILPAVIVT